jgi:hypothetical protein
VCGGAGVELRSAKEKGHSQRRRCGTKKHEGKGAQAIGRECKRVTATRGPFLGKLSRSRPETLQGIPSDTHLAPRQPITDMGAGSTSHVAGVPVFECEKSEPPHTIARRLGAAAGGYF